MLKGSTFQTSILFSLPTKFQNSVKPLSEDSDEVLNGILPGQCMDDIDLQTACLSSYFNTFRLHRNIFCYICKMNNIKKNNPVIDSCVNPINDSFQKCLKRSESNITYPYKNVYCYTCKLLYLEKLNATDVSKLDEDPGCYNNMKYLAYLELRS